MPTGDSFIEEPSRITTSQADTGSTGSVGPRQSDQCHGYAGYTHQNKYDRTEPTGHSHATILQQDRRIKPRIPADCQHNETAAQHTAPCEQFRTVSELHAHHHTCHNEYWAQQRCAVLQYRRTEPLGYRMHQVVRADKSCNDEYQPDYNSGRL